MKKDEIFEAIRRQLETSVEELRKSMEGYKAASDLDENDTRDMEDFSQQDESKEIERQLQVQLDNAQDALGRFDELTGGKVNTGRAGTLIETNHNIFFPGISFPSIQIGNKEVLGISFGSPAFTVIDGAGEGESFKLGEKEYKVLKIWE